MEECNYVLFLPLARFREYFMRIFLPHLVSMTFKLTPFQVQLESVLNACIKSSHPEVFLGKCVLKICLQEI